jgi:hypothetical protein
LRLQRALRDLQQLARFGYAHPRDACCVATAAAQRRRRVVRTNALTFVQHVEPGARLRQDIATSGIGVLLPYAEAPTAVAHRVLAEPALFQRVIRHHCRVFFAGAEDRRTWVLRDDGLDCRRDFRRIRELGRCRVDGRPDGQD